MNPDNEQALPAFAYELQWPQCPRAVQVLSKFVFVGEAIEALERRMLSAGMDGDERVSAAVSTSRHSLQKARSASRHSTSSESSSHPAPSKTDAFMCPVSSCRPPRDQARAHHVVEEQASTIVAIS